MLYSLCMDTTFLLEYRLYAYTHWSVIYLNFLSVGGYIVDYNVT